MQGQEAKLRLLARAASIPESEIENITLAQELTEEQITQAQGETIPSVAGASGSSGSTSSIKEPKPDSKLGKSARSSSSSKTDVKGSKTPKGKEEANVKTS